MRTIYKANALTDSSTDKQSLYKKKSKDRASQFHQTSSVRSMAAKVLQEVVNGASLTRLLATYSDQVALNDRALLAELTFGSCRWYHRLSALLPILMKKPMRKRDEQVRALLIIGFYQLIYMRIKPHAVVAETVNAARQMGKPMFVKLVNGVLRRVQRERVELLQQVDQSLSQQMSMPQWLLDEIKLSWPVHWRQVLGALLEQSPMTLRLNTHRCDVKDYLQKLKREGIDAQGISGLPSALVLSVPLPVNQLPLFHEGVVSVQDAGAQLAAQILDAQSGRTVLDACAAPGGKTGHILERASEIQLTAIDIDQKRLDKVAENLQRLKLEANLQQGDAAKPQGAWANKTYDAILLDVPCSATGVIRRHPDIKLLRRSADILSLVKLQQDILMKVWPLLKQGGVLLYATCSLLKQENDDQIDWFLRKDKTARVVPIELEVEHQPCLHGIQVLPINKMMDGFYYSLLVKK